MFDVVDLPNLVQEGGSSNNCWVVRDI